MAKGSDDFFFSVGFHAWDVAAAKVILNESGGVMVGYRKTKDIKEDISICDERYDICQRKVLSWEELLKEKNFRMIFWKKFEIN